MENSIINERKRICKKLIPKYGFQINKNKFIISKRDLLFHINNNFQIEFFSNSKLDKYICERMGKFYVKVEDLFYFNDSINCIENSEFNIKTNDLLFEYIEFSHKCSIDKINLS